MKLFLNVKQTGTVGSGETPIYVWVEVSDRADAISKLPGVLTESFSGKQYIANLVREEPGEPTIIIEILATGTQP